VAIPIPNLTFAAPSQASSQANFAPAFNFGSGAGQSGINWVMLAIIAAGAFLIIRKA
jgi:hypothetical protein